MTASFPSYAYFHERPAGFSELLEDEALIDSPKIFQSSSIKSAGLSLRSRNLGTELALGKAEEKKSSILFSTVEGGGKSQSKLAGISDNAAENRNSEKSAANIGAEADDLTEKSWVAIGAEPAETEEAQTTEAKAVEKRGTGEEASAKEKTGAKKTTKKDSSWFMGIKLLYVWFDSNLAFFP